VREFEKHHVDVLTKGLRANWAEPGESLFECFNLVPDPTGLRAWEPPELLGCDDLCAPPGWANMDWPFPRIFMGSRDDFLADRETLYRITGSGQTEPLVEAPWVSDLADFREYLVFSCAGGSVIRDPETGQFLLVAPSDVWPLFKTCCNFRGQLVVGDIESAWAGASYKSVGWTGIGRSDFTLSQDNEAGHLPLPWEGRVLRVWSMQDGVAVFSDNGVGWLYPAQHTFGFRPMLDHGPANSHALSGDSRRVCWVDRQGYLWEMWSGKPPKRLGFAEWFGQLQQGTIVGS